jgi:hypothetical protein
MTAGTFAGGTFGFPFGGGVGLFFDNLGRAYPQLYGGTPGLSASSGYTNNLESLLTGTSISGSFGTGSIKANVGSSLDSATGLNGTRVGIGTPGIGVTYGLGPFEMSRDYSQPWVKDYIRDSAAAAGVPSRNNVWEYDYPSPNDQQPLSSPSTIPGALPSGNGISEFQNGQLSTPSGDALGGGLPGMLCAVMQQGQAQQDSDSLFAPNGTAENNSGNNLQGGLLGMLLSLRDEQASDATGPSHESPNAHEKPCRCLSRRLAD